MVEKIRWGIIGTGQIAKKFATGLHKVPDTKLIAVGSRTQENADAFGDAFHVKHRHESYESIANDPDVDVVYVATPHSLHKQNTLMCLQAGKPVLCEKPFAINGSEAMEMISAACERHLFLMEAMWMRFLPLMVKVRAMLKDGVIGEVKMLMADFGCRTDMNPKSRLFDLTLGGGGLLDLGVYPLSLAHMIFGEPSRAAGLAHLGETGVDEQSAFVLGYEGGGLALISSAIRTETPQVAYILGTLGQLFIHRPWWVPHSLTLSLPGRNDEVINFPFDGNGYNYEAGEVANCLRQGKTECQIMPLDETLAIMKQMDELRRQWGLKYPME